MNYKNDLLVTKSINRKEGMDGKAKNTVLYLAIATVIMIIMLVSPGFNNEVYAATLKKPDLTATKKLNFGRDRLKSRKRDTYFNEYVLELNNKKAINNYKNIMGNYRAINSYHAANQEANTFTTLKALGLGDPRINEMLNLSSDQLIRVGGAFEPVMGQIDPNTGKKILKKSVGEISKLASQGKLANITANEKLKKGDAEHKLGYTIWDASNDVGVFCSEEGAPYGGFGFQEGKNQSNGDLTVASNGVTRIPPLSLDKIYKDQINETVGGGKPTFMDNLPYLQIFEKFADMVREMISNPADAPKNIIGKFASLAKNFTSVGTNKDVYTREYSEDIKDKIFKTMKNIESNARSGHSLAQQKHTITYKQRNKDLIRPTGNYKLPSSEGPKIYPIIGDLGYVPNAITLLEGMNNTVDTSAYFPKKQQSQLHLPYEEKIINGVPVFKPTNGAASNGQVYVTPSIVTNAIPKSSRLLEFNNINLSIAQYANNLKGQLTPRIAYAASSFLKREYGWEHAKEIKQLFGQETNKLQNLLNFNFYDLRGLENRFGKIYQSIRNDRSKYADLTSIFTGPHSGSVDSIQRALWNMRELSQNRSTPPGPANLFYKSNVFSNYYKDLLKFIEKPKDEAISKFTSNIYADGYHSDMKVHQNENKYELDASQGSTSNIKNSEEKSIMIKNPKLKYEPKVLPGDGMKIEDARKVKFDKNTQKWTIGPFKLDYLKSGMKKNNEVVNDESKHGTKDNPSEYFTTLTGIKLKGKYIKNSKKDPVNIPNLDATIANVVKTPNSLLNKSINEIFADPVKSLNNLPKKENNENKQYTSNLENVKNFDPEEMRKKINKLNERMKNGLLNLYATNSLNIQGYDPKDPIMVSFLGKMLEFKNDKGEKYKLNINDYSGVRNAAVMRKLKTENWYLNYERLINEFWGTVDKNGKSSFSFPARYGVDLKKAKINKNNFNLVVNFDDFVGTFGRTIRGEFSINATIIINARQAILPFMIDWTTGRTDVDARIELRNLTFQKVSENFNIENFYREATKKQLEKEKDDILDNYRTAISNVAIKENMLNDMRSGKLLIEKVEDQELKKKLTDLYTVYSNLRDKSYEKFEVKKEIFREISNYLKEDNVIKINYNNYFKKLFNLNNQEVELNGKKVSAEFDKYNLFDKNKNIEINKDNLYLFKGFKDDPKMSPEEEREVKSNINDLKRFIEYSSNYAKTSAILLLEDENVSSIIKESPLVKSEFNQLDSDSKEFWEKIKSEKDLEGYIKQKLNSEPSYLDDPAYKYLISNFAPIDKGSLLSTYPYRKRLFNDIENTLKEYIKLTGKTQITEKKETLKKSSFNDQLNDGIKRLVNDATNQITNAIRIGIKSGVGNIVALVKSAIPGASVIPDKVIADGFQQVLGLVENAINLKGLVRNAVNEIVNLLPDSVKRTIGNIYDISKNVNVEKIKYIPDLAEKFLSGGKDSRIESVIGGIIGIDAKGNDTTKDLFKNLRNLDTQFGNNINGAVSGVFDEYDKPKMEANPNKWYSTKTDAQNSKLAQNKNVNKKDTDKGIENIKSWRIKVKKDSKGVVRLPNPNEQFIFEIDYDPALKSIEKARFEFAYMIYGGYLNKYQPYMNRIATTKVTKNINENDQDSVMASIVPHSVFSLGASWLTFTDINLPLRDLPGTNGRADFTLNAEYSSDSQLQQKISNVIASRWIEEVGVELNFTSEKDEKETGLNLMIPIGGKVWEETPINNKKNVGYDNIFKSTDKLKPGIRVTILRNFVEVDHSGYKKIITKLIHKEKARLFKKDGSPESNVIYTDKNGRYGDFYIHDIGFTEKELDQITGRDRNNLNKLNDYEIVYEVRFDYDGMMFEPVTPLIPETDTKIFIGVQRNSDKFESNLSDMNLSNYKEKTRFKNSSHAVENPTIREEYNRDNATITGATELEPNGVTFGRVRDINLENPKFIKYKSQKPLIIGKVKDKEKEHSGALQLGINTLTSKFQERVPEKFDKEEGFNSPTKVAFDKIFMSASTFYMGLQLPGNEKVVYDKKKLEIKEENAIDQVKGVYYESKAFMKDINLGLKKRLPVDINLDHKLNNATVTINKKVYEYSLKDVETGMLTKEEQDEGVLLPIKYNGDDDGNIDGIKEKKDIQNPRKVRRYMDLYKMDYLYRTGMYNVQKPVYKKITGEIEDNKEIEKDPDNRIDPRQLDMFFTYKTIVTNNSPVDSVKINAIDNYYNNKMEIVDKQVVKIVQQDPEFKNAEERQDNIEKPYTLSAQTGISLANLELSIDTPSFRVNDLNSFAGSKDFDPTKYKLEVQRLEQDLNKKEFKAARTLPQDDIDDKTKNIKHSGINAIRLKDDKTPILLAPDETAEIFYTFRIKNAKDLDEVIENNAGETNVFASLETLVNNKEIVLPDAMNLGDFMTTAEIAAFTTYDVLSGLPSAKFDDDSAPDNVRVEELQDNLKVKNFETDTSSAEIMHIRIKPEKELGNESRIVKGLLWEDKRTLNNNGVQTGDGIFNKDTENGIPHHPVTLEERITVQKKGVTNSGYEDIPFIWPEKIKVTDKYNKKIKVNIKTATGFESNVMTGENGNYEFKGVPVGNMVVNLDYSSPKDKLKVYNNKDNRNRVDGAVRAIQNSNLTQEDLVRTVRDKLDKDGKLDKNGKQEAPREVQYYNGVDFKNTLFYEKEGAKTVVKNADRNSEDPINLDKTWITKDMANTQNLSFLRDDEYRRLEISTTFRNMNNELAKYVQLFRLNKDKWKNSAISNADLSLAHKLTSMHGSTPKINFNVENNEYNGVVKDENSSYSTGYTKVKKGVKTHVFPGIYNAKDEKKQDKNNKYIVPNMNLGIVERPRPKQVLNKEITEIKISTADGETPINLKYNVSTMFTKEDDKNINETLYGESPIGQTNVYFSREVDKENSTGIDTILELDRTSLPNGRRSNNDSTIKSGFKYINIDEKLLQNAVINVKYEIYGYNAGEVDRKIEVPNDEVYLKAITKILNSNVTPHLTKEQLTKELMANKGEKLDVIRKIAYREGFDMANGMLYHQSNINNFGYGIFSGLEYYVKLDGISEDKDIDINKTLEDEDTSEVKINKVLERVDNDYKLNLADKDNQGFIPAEDNDIVNMIQGIRTKDQLTSDNKSDDHADILDGNGVSYIKRDKDGNLTGTNLFFNKKYSDKLTPIHNLIKEKGNVTIANINLNGVLKDSKKEISKDSNNIKINNKTYISKWTVKPSSLLSTTTSSSSMVFENIVEILETTSDTGVPPSDIPGSLQPDIDLANENGGGIIPGNKNKKYIIPKEDNPYKDVKGSSPDRTVYVTVDHDGSSTNEIVTLSPPTGLPIFEASKAATIKMTFAVIIISLLTGLVAIKTEKRSNRNKK